MENKVLAVVNGREVTERDLQEMIVKIPKERQSYVKTEEGRRQLLEEMICFELIYNHAKDNKIEEEKDFIDQLEIIKKDLLTQYTIGKLLSEVTISEKEIEEYYNNNKEKFKTEESIVAKHILVATLEEAKKALEEIEKGMSFEEAAEKFSTCPSKSSGGNLGTFGRGRMVPEFEKAAFELEIGVVSEPVKTQFGYHIIKVEHKNQPFIIPFNKMKDSIEFDLKQEAQRNKYFEITNKLKRTYKVEIK
ncbi:peptidylprolyl isomerase [Clostridium sp. MSJ-11]|uniref:Peptidylprolyl isomerase n=1 Tax=Clostridium mobile TaxID=2841512 RepID=A0ABS6EMV0_9CLOT|nr:peptidylprolyl isomerase [Clostridium mobile]MBU5486558.1 peptidylprolyl isomerase [Clostridium mobile]